MQSVQCSLIESETPRRQTIETVRQELSVPGKHTSSEKKQSDRQADAEATYAAFVWLFGPGCI